MLSYFNAGILSNVLLLFKNVSMWKFRFILENASTQVYNANG